MQIKFAHTHSACLRGISKPPSSTHNMQMRTRQRPSRLKQNEALSTAVGVRPVTQALGR